MRIGQLRPPLLANAVFSLACGVAMTVAASVIGRAIGPAVDGLYLLLGVGLVLFSLALGMLALRPSPLAVLAVTAADLTWIVGTAVALFIWWDVFRPLGLVAIGATNAIVGTFACLQLRSILTAFRAPDGAPDEFEVCVAANTPVEAGAFWSVLADMGAIKRYSPALRSSLLSVGDRPGVGCVRTCENTKGQRWSERCDGWDEGRAFSVVFLTEQPGFPYPFARMRGGWRVEPVAPGCRVEVWWRVVPRAAWAAPVLLPLMAAGAQKGFGDVIARMTVGAKGGDPEALPASLLPALRAAPC